MLSGDLSFLFGSNKTVQIVDFSRNKFEFNLSNVVFPASLTSLDLNHNKIFGSLPEELTTLDFQYLNVSYNRLCGKIPVGGKLQSFAATSYFHNRKVAVVSGRGGSGGVGYGDAGEVVARMVSNVTAV
ncbi:hypothetical protein C3L33_04362, partial [Rhododendron williamsianum]